MAGELRDWRLKRATHTREVHTRETAGELQGRVVALEKRISELLEIASRLDQRISSITVKVE